MSKKSKSKNDTFGNMPVNHYERIDKDLLQEPENPNFGKTHNFKIPFRMIVCAPSGSGKSNFVIDLISRFSHGKGTFSSINIITKNSDEPLYNQLKRKSDQILISEGIGSIPQLDKFDKDLNHLVIFDDLVLEKDQHKIEQYYIRCRKQNVSVIYLSQSFYAIPKMIRKNANYMVILKLGNQRDVNMIMREFALGVDKEDLIKIYQYATAEKFSVLIVNLDSDITKRFSKGYFDFIRVRTIDST